MLSRRKKLPDSYLNAAELGDIVQLRKFLDSDDAQHDACNDNKALRFAILNSHFEAIDLLLENPTVRLWFKPTREYDFFCIFRNVLNAINNSKEKSDIPLKRKIVNSLIEIADSLHFHIGPQLDDEQCKTYTLYAKRHSDTLHPDQSYSDLSSREGRTYLTQHLSATRARHSSIDSVLTSSSEPAKSKKKL